MESLHLILTDGLGIIYDWIEDRFGKAAAWLATCTLGFAILAVLCAICIAVI